MPMLFAAPSPFASPFAYNPFQQPYGPEYRRRWPEFESTDDYASQLERIRLARLAEHERNEQRRRVAEQEYVDALRAEIESQQRLRAREQALKDLEKRQRQREQEIRNRRAAQIQVERRRQILQDPVLNRDASDLFLRLLGIPSDRTSHQETPANRNLGPSVQAAPPAPTSSARADARPVNVPGDDLTPAKVKAIVLAHARINGLRKELAALTSEFAFPDSLSFVHPPASPHAAPSSLAFTASNKPLLAHEESLLRLLTKLDEIDSIGDEQVKQNRKALVNDVEAELTAVDTFKIQQWEKYVKEVFGEVDVTDKAPEGGNTNLPGYDVAVSTSSAVDEPLDANPADLAIAESSAIAPQQPLDITPAAAAPAPELDINNPVNHSAALVVPAQASVSINSDGDSDLALTTSDPVPSTSASVVDNISSESPMEITPHADLEAVNSEVVEQGVATPAGIDASVKEGDKTDGEDEYEMI